MKKSFKRVVFSLVVAVAAISFSANNANSQSIDPGAFNRYFRTTTFKIVGIGGGCIEITEYDCDTAGNNCGSVTITP